MGVPSVNEPFPYDANADEYDANATEWSWSGISSLALAALKHQFLLSLSHYLMPLDYCIVGRQKVKYWLAIGFIYSLVNMILLITYTLLDVLHFSRIYS